jgi:CMP-N-acetylneuraminic acid synthetase
MAEQLLRTSVPNKNIKLIDGTPLVVFPILEAKKTKEIEDIYVSTDSDDIINVVEKFGVKII